MSITAGQDILAADFIDSTGLNGTATNDNGRVAKLETQNAIGRQINREFLKSVFRFGGNGSDGALSISSGTTTVSLAGARLVILQYSSISITGTGKLAFSNPHADGTIIIIKCMGNCTLTSSSTPMIDASGMGGSAGGGGSRSSGPANTPGGSGSDGKTYGYFKTNGASATTGGAVADLSMALFGGGIAGDFTGMQTIAKYPMLFVGAGGSGGTATVQSGSGTTTGGDGGYGGGCLVMEIAGAINFTTANGISVAGKNGANGVIASAGSCNAGGGGGGAGGFCHILYNVLTAFSGTVNVAGGTGGNALVVGGTNGAGGAGGGSLTDAGDNQGSTSTNGNKNGGDGGNGLSFNALNTAFA